MRVGKRRSTRRRGIGHRLLEVVEALFPEALHLALGEARLERHLGQQPERGRQAGAGDLDMDRQAVPAGHGAQAGAETLGRLDEGDGVPSPGAFGHGPRRQRGDACQAGVLAARAATRVSAHQQLGLQQGPAWHMGAQDGRDRWAGRPLEVREIVRRVDRRAGRRSSMAGRSRAAASARGARTRARPARRSRRRRRRHPARLRHPRPGSAPAAR